MNLRTVVREAGLPLPVTDRMARGRRVECSWPQLLAPGRLAPRRRGSGPGRSPTYPASGTANAATAAKCAAAATTTSTWKIS